MSAPSPAPVTAADVAAAAERIGTFVRRTPVLELEAGAMGLDAPPVLKLELLQVTGSFKARGAFSLLTGADVPPAGVVAASGGNFGLAVAHAARALGHDAHVFVPDTSPEDKIARLGALGADVRVVPGTYQQALEASRAFLDQTGGLFAHAYDQPAVVAGQGTCAIELDEQVPDLDTVLVAVGGAGLIGGVAAWFQSRVDVIAVESRGCDAFHAALVAGEPVDVEPSGLCVSSLGATRVGGLGFAARDHIAQSLLVTDHDVRDAQRALYDVTRLVSEPGGAVALAALLSGRYEPAPGERVGVILCGANTDPAALSPAG